jgi:predicted DNA-binding transcriptional regulator YafY
MEHREVVVAANQKGGKPSSTIRISRKLSDADTRIRQADRLAKPLRILHCVQAGPGWNKSRFAEEFECSERTVERFVDVLKYAGVPIYFDKKRKCYCLLHNLQYPLLDLSRNDLLGQTRHAAIGQVSEMFPGSNAKTTIKQIASRAGLEGHKLVEAAMELVTAMNLKVVDHSHLEPVLRTIQLALVHKQKLTGSYFSPFNNSTNDVVLAPIRLCFLRNAWYLIATPESSSNPQTYRAVRFRTLNSTKQSCDIPAEFDLREYFGNAWIVWRGTPSYEVEILFSNAAAGIVAETNWHHTQKVRRHTDGSATICFTVDGLDEIVWWLLCWAPFAIVKKPIELRQMLVEQLRLGLQSNPVRDGG